MAENIIKELLVKIVKEHNFVGYDVKIEPVTNTGANYTSNLYNVTLTKKEDVVHLFAKVAAVGEKFRSTAPKLYETEQFVYTKLLKIYEQLEEKYDVPQEHRLTFAKFYGYNPNEYEETIILENLVMNGYEAFDRFKTFDWQYAKSAVTNLARFHGLSLAYGKYYPEEYAELVGKLKFKLPASEEEMDRFYASLITRAIETTREENRDKLKGFFESFHSKQFLEYYQFDRTPVLGHGDYRPSNMMHKIREDGTVEITIVDLQTLQGSNAIVDLLYFIFTGSDEEFRAEHYDELVDHYYKELSATMTRLRLNPQEVYSRADFDEELQAKLSFGLVVSAFVLPVITVAIEDAPKVDENLDITSFSIETVSDLYAERLNGVVNDYVKFGVLK